MISKSHWMKATSPPFGPHLLPCPGGNLQLCVSFIDENHATGSSVPLAPPMGLRVLFIRKKDGSLQLCIDFQGAQLNLPERLVPTPAHFRPLRGHQEKHESTPKSTSGMHTISFWVAPGEEGKTAFRTHYWFFQMICNA